MSTPPDGYTDEQIKQARDAAMGEPSFKSGIGFLRAFLAALPERPQAQPILADDGRSLGQVASEAYHEAYGVGIVEKWQRAAQAVVAAARPAIEAEFLTQAQQAEANPWTPTVGDVVRLKSGGPVMTVFIMEEGFVWCRWFVGEQLLADSFPAACLTPAQP